MRLLIISNMAHYIKDSKIVGWGPTVQEINHLATLFDKVDHIGCLYDEPSPKSSLPYDSENISLIPLQPAGGNTLKDKLDILRLTPSYLSKITKAMNDADVVHLRCPANIPLLALVTLIFRKKPKFSWVKYAGNWNSYPGQAISYKLQRWILNHNFHRGVVTINGHWPDQPEHIFSFLNPSFSENEYLEEKELALEKKLFSPVYLLFVGYFNSAKGVEQVIQIAQRLSSKSFDYQLTLVGDGPERSMLEEVVNKNSMGDCVHFTGWQPITALHQYYRKAHMFIFPSESEGWPKVLSEAMAHGVVPIASDVASIPEILGGAQAGLAFPPEDTDAYVDAIINYANDEKTWKQASLNGIRAASDFTYEYYLSAVKKMFRNTWDVELNHD